MRVSFILILILFSCCSRTDKRNIDYIIFGTFCGECVGQCSTMYKIDSTAIQVDTSNSFFSSGYHGSTYYFNGYTLDTNTQNTFFSLTNDFPELLNGKSLTYGNPDAYDQCGIYIQIQEQGSIKEFYIDTNEKKVPFAVNNYIKQLYTSVKKYQ